MKLRVAKWKRGNITSESSEKKNESKTAKLFSETNFVGNQRKNVFPRRIFHFPEESESHLRPFAQLLFLIEEEIETSY